MKNNNKLYKFSIVLSILTVLVTIYLLGLGKNNQQITIFGMIVLAIVSIPMVLHSHRKKGE